MNSDKAWPGTMGNPPVSEKEAAAHAALMAAMYRSEAFAEDLEDLLATSPVPVGEPGTPGSGVVRSAWMFALPVALAVIGSASALVWV